MFGIGYQEMFVILVVAMIVFGPSRLPELAGQVGRWVRDFRRMSSDLTGEFEKTFAEVDEVKKSFQRELNSIQNEVEGVGKSTRGDLKKTAPKSATAAKKPAALKSGTAASATKTKSASSSKAGATNGAKKTGGLDALVVVATKADPLADVSFLDIDLVTTKNGSSAAANGAVSLEDDAIARVRRRRAAASYGRRISA
jgi:Tat protein translocase TatB subunit